MKINEEICLKVKKFIDDNRGSRVNYKSIKEHVRITFNHEKVLSSYCIQKILKIIDYKYQTIKYRNKNFHKEAYV